MRISDQAVILALGSNLPGAYACVEDLLEAALAALEEAGFHVDARSRWWVSSAWPDPAEPSYLNGIAVCRTGLSPEGAMAALHSLEETFGRVRGERNAPRTLDLDLVAYGRRVGEAPVTPHPRAHERRFVMGPLAELDPDWRHPVTDLPAHLLARTAQVGQDAHPSPGKDSC